MSGLFLRFWDMKKYISAINHQFTHIIPLRLDPALKWPIRPKTAKIAFFWKISNLGCKTNLNEVFLSFFLFLLPFRAKFLKFGENSKFELFWPFWQKLVVKHQKWVPETPGMARGTNFIVFLPQKTFRESVLEISKS